MGITILIIIKWFKKLLKNYDLLIYRLAFKSINRLCVNNPGTALLIELAIKEWLKGIPLDEDIRWATKNFFNLIKEKNKIK